MVSLYTDKIYVSGDVTTDNDSFFDRFITAKSIDTDDNGCKYLKQIDGAKILDAEMGTIITPLGATVLENISTGTKTVLNLIHLQRINKPAILDVTECGANALDAVFELMDNYVGEVKVLLSHAATSKCKDHIFCINDTHIVNDAVELSIRLMEVRSGNL